MRVLRAAAVFDCGSHRVRMTHNLIVSYGLYRDMEVFVRARARAALLLLALA